MTKPINIGLLCEEMLNLADEVVRSKAQRSPPTLLTKLFPSLACQTTKIWHGNLKIRREERFHYFGKHRGQYETTLKISDEKGRFAKQTVSSLDSADSALPPHGGRREFLDSRQRVEHAVMLLRAHQQHL